MSIERLSTHTQTQIHARWPLRHRHNKHIDTHRVPSCYPNHCSTAGVQLLKVESAGTAAETALLVDVKSKHPDATSTTLLRLLQVRCRWALLARSADLLCVVLCAARSICRTPTTRGHASFTGTGASARGTCSRYLRRIGALLRPILCDDG